MGCPASRKPRQRWPAQTLPERRELLREVLDCVFVLNRREPRAGRGPFTRVCVARPQPIYRSATRGRSRSSPSSNRARGQKHPRLGAAGLRPWGDARVRAELSPFLRDRNAFPVFINFQHKGLALLPRRGRDSWGMRALGDRVRPVPLRAAPSAEGLVGGASSLRTRRFTARRGAVADGRRLRRADRLMLYMALKRYGGRGRWAAEFGRKLSWRQRDTTTFWTEARIEQALRSLADEASTFPARKQMATAGYRGLYSAVGPTSSRVQWAERLQPLSSAQGACVASLDRPGDREDSSGRSS